MIRVEELIFEVTRRCNMACGHCLRGEAEDVDLNKETIDNMLGQVGEIGTICFTGGEPSLVVDKILYILSECKRREIYVGSFYVATNGKKISQEFVMAMLQWYLYCADNEISAVEFSNDEYHHWEHDEKWPEGAEILKGLSFFRMKYPESDIHGWTADSIIAEGRASDNPYGRKPGYDINVEDYGGGVAYVEGITYVNCEGNVIGGCDFSYKSQRNPDLIYCKVGEFEESVMKRLEEDAGNEI